MCGTDVEETAPVPAGWAIAGELPARRGRETEPRVPALTRGEGVWWSRPPGDQSAR